MFDKPKKTLNKILKISNILFLIVSVFAVITFLTWTYSPNTIKNLDKKIISMISHLGSNIPVAVGVALAAKIRKEDLVALTFIGEGGTSIGDFHEGLNFAAVRKLPLVLIIENNKFAYSTPTALEYACDNLIDRAPGYGLPGVLIDGTDVREVYKATKAAEERES